VQNHNLGDQRASKLGHTSDRAVKSNTQINREYKSQFSEKVVFVF
jgi:hypothetical protein